MSQVNEMGEKYESGKVKNKQDKELDRLRQSLGLPDDGSADYCMAPMMSQISPTSYAPGMMTGRGYSPVNMPQALQVPMAGGIPLNIPMEGAGYGQMGGGPQYSPGQKGGNTQIYMQHTGQDGSTMYMGATLPGGKGSGMYDAMVKMYGEMLKETGKSSYKNSN